MLRSLALLGFIAVPAIASATCNTMSYFPPEQMESLRAHIPSNVTTKHYYAIANESSIKSSYKLCRRVILKGSVDGSYFNEECRYVTVKGFGGYTDVDDFNQTVTFAKQYQTVDVTIDSWIEGDCKSKDIKNYKIFVF